MIHQYILYLDHQLYIYHLKHIYSFTKKYKKNTFWGLIMIPLSISSNLLFPWLVIQIIDKKLMPGQHDG